MLRADNKVELVKLPWTLTGWLFEGRWAVRSGRKVFPPRWPQRKIDEVIARQAEEPFALLEDGRRALWYFHERFYWADEQLAAEDVMALVLKRERGQKRELDSARSLMRAEQNGERSRPPIARDVRLAVFERDGGKCVECGSSFDIQYDHILPFAHGGATTVENLQILCADCNRQKEQPHLVSGRGPGRHMIDELLEFCAALEQRRASYRLDVVRPEALMVTVAVPGERWEIESFGTEAWRSSGSSARE